MRNEPPPTSDIDKPWPTAYRLLEAIDNAERVMADRDIYCLSPRFGSVTDAGWEFGIIIGIMPPGPEAGYRFSIAASKTIPGEIERRFTATAGRATEAADRVEQVCHEAFPDSEWARTMSARLRCGKVWFVAKLPGVSL